MKQTCIICIYIKTVLGILSFSIIYLIMWSLVKMIMLMQLNFPAKSREIQNKMSYFLIFLGQSLDNFMQIKCRVTKLASVINTYING